MTVSQSTSGKQGLEARWLPGNYKLASGSLCWERGWDQVFLWVGREEEGTPLKAAGWGQHKRGLSKAAKGLAWECGWHAGTTVCAGTAPSDGGHSPAGSCSVKLYSDQILNASGWDPRRTGGENPSPHGWWASMGTSWTSSHLPTCQGIFARPLEEEARVEKLDVLLPHLTQAVLSDSEKKSSEHSNLQINNYMYYLALK